ncbi:hypothetical protein GCM10027034_43070 [Ramlibacter solisilvae]|uniref:Uncharacterized protein n=1 Tax=Ramlibacter tataouinensis TaxID=94132 RepID=A0A127JTD1_9BURK|nr:hypothetical protein [Ramlibacter tataouinensis]AMO23216.1 hypothetical protein UC35_10335 [Ramlibacter tataouinensis]
MHTFHALYEAARSPRTRRVLDRLAREASALIAALLRPGKLVAEVEAMRKLHVEASRIEATRPARAAVLRHQAARVGLS